MRTTREISQRRVFPMATLATLAVISLLVCAPNASGQWTTSGNNISNSNSGNVGIGTPAPETTLHVATESSANPRGIMNAQHTNDGNGGLVFFRKSRGTRAVPAAVVSGDSIGNLYSDAYDGASWISGGRIRFAVDGTVSSGVVPTAVQFFSGNNGSGGIERMRISSNGNIGIGTTSPTRPLEVVAADGEAMRVYRNGSGINWGVSLKFALQNASGTEVDYAGVHGQIATSAVGSEGGNLLFTTATAGSLTEKMRLTSLGNLGIGTTGPTSKLHIVSGTDNSTSFLHLDTGVHGGTSMTVYGTTNNESGFDMAVYRAGQYFSRFGVNNYGNLYLQPGAGNVGVGTSTPSYKFDVQGGQLNSSGGLCIAGDCKTAWSQVSGGSSQWTTSGSNIYYNAGSVGIGTTAPAASLLHLQSGSNSYLRIGAPLAYQSSIAFNDDSNGQDIVLYRPGGTRDFSVWTATASNVLNVTQAGNVGIGTAGPGYKLDVNGEINATGLRINGTPISGGGSSQWTTSGSNVYYNTGSVGIGTSSPVFDSNPARYLNVDAGANAIGSIGAAGGTGSLSTAVSQVAFVNSSLGTTDKRLATIVGSTDTATNSGNLDFYTATAGTFPAPRIRVSSSGNVGVGVTDPATKLHVGGGTRVDGTNGRVYVGTGAVAGYRGLEIIEENATTFSIRHHDPNVAWQNIAINPYGGNVGIGTLAPATKFHVVGDGTITGNLTVSGNLAAKYQDVAEWVPAKRALPAGTVTVLNPEQSNQVMASVKAYDTRVAGVISQTPGIALGEAGHDKLLVATTGRVRVRVDATRAPIHVGDLLVTSDKEGMAMKSVPVNLGGVEFHRPGTLIGKALEPLASGEGEILVLLSLQ